MLPKSIIKTACSTNQFSAKLFVMMNKMWNPWVLQNSYFKDCMVKLKKFSWFCLEDGEVDVEFTVLFWKEQVCSWRKLLSLSWSKWWTKWILSQQSQLIEKRWKWRNKCITVESRFAFGWLMNWIKNKWSSKASVKHHPYHRCAVMPPAWVPFSKTRIANIIVVSWSIMSEWWVRDITSSTCLVNPYSGLWARLYRSPIGQQVGFVIFKFLVHQKWIKARNSHKMSHHQVILPQPTIKWLPASTTRHQVVHYVLLNQLLFVNAVSKYCCRMNQRQLFPNGTDWIEAWFECQILMFKCLEQTPQPQPYLKNCDLSQEYLHQGGKWWNHRYFEFVSRRMAMK